MQFIIDTNLRQVVSAFGSTSAAPGITIKDQDTLSLQVYFQTNGVSVDLGSTLSLEFEIEQVSGTTGLAFTNTFNRQVDGNGNAYYNGFVNFNTAAMLAAVGSSLSIQCAGEFRYQSTTGEIIHCLDIPFTVYRTIITESAVDHTTANFTVPAVSSNVSISINNTSWLPAAGNNISIAGAGVYQMVSVTNSTTFVAQNTGATGNATSGTVINSGAAVGLGAYVFSTYPASASIELISSRDVASGHAGLDSNTLLLSREIPVDGTTLVNNSTTGKVQQGFILANVAASWTTPAANATVVITVDSSANLVLNQMVRIPIAGFYFVTAISGTSVTIKNSGDPFNASSGVNITSGVLLPAQAVSGSGSSGQNAFTTTSASFTVPNIGAGVTIAVANTAWIAGNGQVLFIQGAGYYSVSSVVSSTQVTVTNLGTANNSISGTNVLSGSNVTPGGATGATGVNGNSAYSQTTAAFTMPNSGSTVSVSMSSTAWLSASQIVYIATAGYMSVQSITNATTAVLVNPTGYSANASSGTNIASGVNVSPGGLIGPQGAGGAGLNAFTTLSANFTQPAVLSTVTINVAATAWMAVNQIIFIQGGGHYQVSSITDSTHAVVTNLGYAGNAAVSATVTGSGTQIVTPGGLQGVTGNAYTTTSASFTMPAISSTVTINVGTTAFMTQGQNIYVQGAGYFSVSSITDGTHLVGTNLGSAGNVSSGSSITSGAGVVTAGATGPQGAGGSGGGAALSDATTTGFSLINNTSGILKRLTGSGSAVVTDTGTTLNVAVNNLNNAGFWDPQASGVYWHDDFNIQTPSPQWVAQSSGSAVVPTFGASSYGIDSTKKCNGVSELATGTAASNAASAFARDTINNGTLIQGGTKYGLGALTFKTRVFFPSALPGTGINYIFRTGMAQTAAGTGAYSFTPGGSSGSATDTRQTFSFLYQPDTNSGQWVIECGSTTPTRTNTSISVAADTAYDLEFDINAAWTSVTFYINGTLVATVTTDIPTTQGTQYASLIRGSGSTTSFKAELDYMSFLYQYTR